MDSTLTPLCKNGPNSFADPSDYFTCFYRSLITANQFASFEYLLLYFFSNILKKESCIFYRVVQQQNSYRLTMQRGSYIPHIPIASLPLVINLEAEQFDRLTRASSHQPFLSLEHLNSHLDPLSEFQDFQPDLSCGLLLQAEGRFLGLLLYDKPLNHPHFHSPIRLMQFAQFISAGLFNCETYNIAILDQLTQVYRKHFFMDQLNTQLLNYPNQEFLILMLDVDHFKQFNDTYGHQSGDVCLYQVASTIKNSLRSQDVVARFGGEEFICLLRTNMEQGHLIAERIRSSISSLELSGSLSTKVSVTISIGISQYSLGMRASEIIHQADSALYKAKQTGRNRTVVFSA